MPPTAPLVPRRTLIGAMLALPLLGGAAGCARSSGVDAEAAQASRGPITVWFSYDQFELQWGADLVEQWNAEHPDEPVRMQEIPAGRSSEEVITAAITAGTTPDLLFNVALAPLPMWARSGGLVDLTTFDDAERYAVERTGAERVEQFRIDGGLYVLPWKTGPVMIMYNKELFAAAGLDPENPGMDTYDSFLDGARTLVSSGAAPSAIWPNPGSEFYNPWYDFYPLFLAETGGTQLVEDGAAMFDGEVGLGVARFWERLYREGLAPHERSVDDAMGTSSTAMQITGPWAVAAYRDLIDVGFMPVPTAQGVPADEVVTFADSKNIAMFTTSRNRATAWDFIQFATSLEQDGTFLEVTGQMPLRTDLPGTFSDYFAQNPLYAGYGASAARAVDVPLIPNSIEVWQRFRGAFSASVIFGEVPIDEAFGGLGSAVEQLVEVPR